MPKKNAETIKSLLNKASVARRENRLEDAKRAASSAIELSRHDSNKEHYAAAIKSLGQIERDSGNVQSSISLYEQAADIYRKHKNELQIAHTLRHLGDLHFDLDQLKIADSYYEEALSIYRNSAQTGELDLANMIRSVAILKEKEGNIPEAISLWKEAKSLYEDSDIKPGIEECKQRLEELG